MKINVSLGCITIFPSRIILATNCWQTHFCASLAQFPAISAFLRPAYPQVSSRVCILPDRVSPAKSLVELGKVEAFCSPSLQGGRPFASSFLPQKTSSASADTAYASVQRRPHSHIRYLHTCRPDTLQKYGLYKSKSSPPSALPPTRTRARHWQRYTRVTSLWTHIIT